MTFNIKSFTIAIVFMTRLIFAKDKLTEFSVIEKINSSIKEYRVTAYVNDTTDENCSVSCINNNVNSCKFEAVNSTINYYTCNITPFRPNFVSIKVIDKVNTYVFNGMHYYDQRDICEDVSASDITGYEKFDF